MTNSTDASRFLGEHYRRTRTLSRLSKIPEVIPVAGGEIIIRAEKKSGRFQVVIDYRPDDPEQTRGG